MDSNHILHTNKDRQKCGKQIQDGGRTPSWKIEKSWNLSNRLTDFDKGGTLAGGSSTDRILKNKSNQTSPSEMTDSKGRTPENDRYS